VAGVILPVLGELDREALVRALVYAGEETLDEVARHEREVPVFRQRGRVEAEGVGWHGCGPQREQGGGKRCQLSPSASKGVSTSSISGSTPVLRPTAARRASHSSRDRYAWNRSASAAKFWSRSVCTSPRTVAHSAGMHNAKGVVRAHPKTATARPSNSRSN